MSTALASHVDTRYWYQWPAALARYLPQKGKRRSSEANGGAWVDLENAGKLLPPRTCLGLSVSAFISRHDHYPGAYEGARFQWGGRNENTEFPGASLHDFGVTFVILGVVPLLVLKSREATARFDSPDFGLPVLIQLV